VAVSRALPAALDDFRVEAKVSWTSNLADINDVWVGIGTPTA
jgi:hypothetical protein